MGSKYLWIEADACHPAREQTGVLAGGHRFARAAPSFEEVFASLLAIAFQEVVDCLAGLIGQLEFDRPPSLLLPHGRAIDRIATWSNIFNAQGDDVTAAQFAIDREIEQGKIAHTLFDQQ